MNLIRIFFLFVIVMVALSVIRGLFVPKPNRGPDDGREPTRRPTRKGKLVKDPVCGTYVSPEGAPTASSGGQSFFFCSESCRDKFLAPTA